MTDDFRSHVAVQLHKNMQVGRPAIFGDNDPKPINLIDDAETMFPGAVGPNYRPGGVVLLAINPGGGGDAYRTRTPLDEQFYPLLMQARDAEGVESFDAIQAFGSAFFQVLPGWNINRIISPCIDAAGVALDETAYLNAVPYRTREDREPTVGAKRQAWNLVTMPLLEVLQPGIVIALGKKAGSVLSRFYDGPAKAFVVPRTIGDSYVSEAAQEVLGDIQAYRKTH